MLDLERLVRKNIKELQPYSSARNEYELSSNNDQLSTILLDANESPFNAPYNRYPDPLQKQLKIKISKIRNIKPEQIFIGNGSDEAIDLLIRIFSEPAQDNIISFEPSYGMYEVCANINNVEIKKVPLTTEFQPDLINISAAIDKNSKLLFICSPNNPTSNIYNKKDVISIIENFEGIVVIDEAYIDFSEHEGYLKDLERYPNLVILQTLSKSWAMAGVRVGMAFADERIINFLNKIKYPYNVNLLSQQYALESINNGDKHTEWIKTILAERRRVEKALKDFSFTEKVFKSDANFLLVKVKHHDELFDYLKGKKLIVRDCSKQKLCEDCIRITIGKPEENNLLIKTLNNFNLTKD